MAKKRKSKKRPHLHTPRNREVQHLGATVALLNELDFHTAAVMYQSFPWRSRQYEEYLAQADEHRRPLEEQGETAALVWMHLGSFEAWCSARGRKPDSVASWRAFADYLSGQAVPFTDLAIIQLHGLQARTVLMQIAVNGGAKDMDEVMSQMTEHLEAGIEIMDDVRHWGDGIWAATSDLQLPGEIMHAYTFFAVENEDVPVTDGHLQATALVLACAKHTRSDIIWHHLVSQGEGQAEVVALRGMRWSDSGWDDIDQEEIERIVKAREQL